MQSNTIKGKYEAAINKLTWDTKFVSTYTQRYITDPFLRINGISEYITWPLTERQDAQIASLYKNDVIPASDFRINNHVGWNAFLDDVLVNVRKDFDQEHVTATLSHLCFDGRGSPSALAPSAAVPNTLGVLIVWLPSRYLGSRLVFQSDRRSETMDDTLLPTTTLQCLATYLSTQVVSTQIMWGRRVALVYNLVCTKPECGFRTAPETQEAATAVLMEIAKEPFQRHPLVCRYIAKPSGLSFEKLSVEDAALADALLATGCYDVALATVERRGDIDPLAWGVYKTEADVIVRCITHPDCSMPRIVCWNLVGMPIDLCLELVSYTHGEEALIFWHKRYRALLADADCVMSSVYNIIVEKRERVPLEIDSTREFLLGAMSMFTHEAASRLRFHMNAMELMGSLLLIYDKWDLVRLFVAHVVSVTPTTPLHNSIGPFLRKCVVQYGWPH
ncbi:hypothetical protein SPRG_21597 [Saprolegnia parasitica CBS 223.65]|uniref:Uncharacterized protein n=1 Tax=Saprolegnia parasitica (strain CBS 223.65) TaxID=695850 RepID=A0A067BR00_SAPPC|nr:hypothetical protein SPRG_21597 [Saprolegnia parasitica CBS 223.65]KDO19195.1 hypothetical protein SPRG_21597 [Saprolegnia parasitica CBS 223.65]|eukprot:XP_012210095.1 hypothetical protein SPRG_21597 [Saprolegnia parasitica CBS 223.65]